MLEQLKNWDTDLLLFINGHHNSLIDQFMYWSAYRFTWIPLYAILAFVLFKNYKTDFWKIALFIILLIVASDQLTNLIKFSVMRYRPCRNNILAPQIHLVNGECGGKYGFTSAHAANTWALTTFLILTVYSKIKWVAPVFIAWAVLNCYSRVYLGVHYPGDVFCAAIMGIVIARIFSLIFILVQQKINKQKIIN